MHLSIRCNTTEHKNKHNLKKRANHIEHAGAQQVQVQLWHHLITTLGVAAFHISRDSSDAQCVHQKQNDPAGSTGLLIGEHVNGHSR